MGAMLFFSRDVTIEKLEDQWTGAYVNSQYWDAFGDLLDEVFLSHYPQLHEVIKSEEGYYLKFYSFADLGKEDFNLAVKLIREHLAKMTPSDWQSRDYITDMEKWQEMARVVWRDTAEEYVVLDSRYDAKLAGDPHP